MSVKKIEKLALDYFWYCFSRAWNKKFFWLRSKEEIHFKWFFDKVYWRFLCECSVSIWVNPFLSLKIHYFKWSIKMCVVWIYKINYNLEMFLKTCCSSWAIFCSTTFAGKTPLSARIVFFGLPGWNLTHFPLWCRQKKSIYHIDKLIEILLFQLIFQAWNNL